MNGFMPNPAYVNMNPMQNQAAFQQQFYNSYLQYCMMNGLNAQDQNNYNKYCQMWMMNNPMMMNMNNQMIGGMNNPMMDMPPMNNMNIPQNMGMMGVMNCCNFPLNNFGFNNLYNLDNDRINNSNCKFVRLYYNNEFIQNVTIFNQDNYTSISNTFKQILFSYGKKSYRGARPEETIERSSPNETLEFLINRGVFEENPSVQIINKTRYRNYYNSPNNMFEDIQNGDELKVEYLSKIYGGLCSIDFIDIDKLTNIAKELLTDFLIKAESQTYTKTPQNGTPSFAPLISKEQTFISFENQTAEQINNLVAPDLKTIIKVKNPFYPSNP